MENLSRSLPALALAALFGAGAAAAQAPLQAPALAPPHSIWFDAGALADDEFRGGVEAFTLGRVTLGASVSYTHTVHPREASYPPIYYLGAIGVTNEPVALICDPQYCGGDYASGDPQHYRAWTAALDARFYPASFSFRNGASRAMVYAGAHAGFRWSTWDESVVYYPCPYCAYPLDNRASRGAPRPTPADSVVVMPPIVYPMVPNPTPTRHSRGGLEPGLDVGVRLIPFGPLLLEVGGRFTLLTADDRMRRGSPGDVESRLILAAGFAW